MSEFKRLMYVESVSGSAVTFERHRNSGSRPDANAGTAIYQVGLVTGNSDAANADSTVFQADCSLWEVTFRKLG